MTALAANDKNPLSAMSRNELETKSRSQSVQLKSSREKLQRRDAAIDRQEGQAEREVHQLQEQVAALQKDNDQLHSLCEQGQLCAKAEALLPPEI